MLSSSRHVLGRRYRHPPRRPLFDPGLTRFGFAVLALLALGAAFLLAWAIPFYAAVIHRLAQ